MIPKFLMSSPGDDPVVSEAVFQASPTRLFRAWTEPEEVRSWFGFKPYSLESARIDLRPGGAYCFEFSRGKETYSAVTGEYIRVEPGELLIFSWRHEKVGESGETIASGLSQVTVRFQAHQGGTLLTVIHEGIPQMENRRNVARGWSTSLGGLQHSLDLDGEKFRGSN